MSYVLLSGLIMYDLLGRAAGGGASQEAGHAPRACEWCRASNRTAW